MQYDIHVTPTTRFYALGGGSYFFDAKAEIDYYGRLPLDQNRLEDPYRIGLGIGFEVPLGSLLGLYLNLTTTYFERSGDLQLYPYGGFAFYFR
jgi:hypothetical protein